MCSAYNVIKSPKELQLCLETGHWQFPEGTEALMNWLMNKLKGQWEGDASNSGKAA